ncbi:MAG: response regulator [Deltaproteobacteria bacterium]|nr:response regulator [Deltaproteobacteria bacterium]
MIEDSEADARLMLELLKDVQGARFETDVVDRLAKGLERLAKGTYNVVMSDLHLPDSQGISTILNVRAQAEHIPVIVLTGMDDEEMAIRAMQEGAQDYLVKGQVDPNLVGRSIRYAIERKRIEEQLLHHALHDVLTGLPNRPVFIDRLDRAMPGSAGAIHISSPSFISTSTTSRNSTNASATPSAISYSN